MNITGWGHYPAIESVLKMPKTRSALKSFFVNDKPFVGIPRAMGRSYGDSSLARHVIDTRSLNNILHFDEKTGIVHCEAGTSLADLLGVFVPKGWFLPVTPGTKFVSIGGAIASDVHGKNHHCDGCFSDHLISINLMLASGEIVRCSEDENCTLYRATCGGMGLTGVIVSAEFRLIPIASTQIIETRYKARNLQEICSLFDENSSAKYAVAWIDCLAKGENLGRSLLMLGEHSSDGGYQRRSGKPFSLPFNLPSWTLNRYSIGAFNSFYYHRSNTRSGSTQIHYEPFFYPLDGIHNWNRMYGKQGFVQYQFVLPWEAGLEGLQSILKKISGSGRGSFLAVLKLFGEENKNYLSFPMKGYTLAVDFKMDNNLLSFLDELDKIVLDYQGRIYLTKDARMSEETFKKSYPKWHEFAQIRHQFGADKVFNSLQSNRLGI